MRLSKKTFCYSILISLIIVLFILLYFAFMLPSLYVEHIGQGNLDSLVKVQEGYTKNRSYNGLKVKNPTGSATIEIPLEGNQVYLAGKAFRISVEIKDQDLLEILDQLRNAIKKEEYFSDVEIPDVNLDKIKKKFDLDDGGPFSQVLSAKFQVEEMGGIKIRKGKIHQISDSLVVFEGGMNDGDNDYTTYIAAGKTADAIIFSFLPVMTPQMKEIRPIVLNSLPMITAVVFLLVLIASQMFSGRIVNPIVRLARYAQDVKAAGYTELEPLKIQEKDEIGELGNILNELYAKLLKQYQELEDKTQTLARENKRQEVFLRASSHQLKTPVTAALLLTEGMISEIGKYKDTKTYLPEVKKQLLTMRKIVEDILYLNHFADHIRKEPVDMDLLVREALENYRITAEERKLHFQYEPCRIEIVTDGEIMRKIVDNLVSNAVAYTPEGGDITIRFWDNQLVIHNGGVHIDETLLPHIYEPFVSSDTRQKGRGLGLYVISYYAELLGLQIDICNEEQGVTARLSLRGKQNKSIERSRRKNLC